MNVNETSFHYFLECPAYHDPRIDLKQVYDQQDIFLSIDSILLGEIDTNYNTNTILFDAVHRYIVATERLSTYL